MPSDVQKHGGSCVKGCGRWTYRKSLVCRECDPEQKTHRVPGRKPSMPDPTTWPEEYLMRCAEELLKRHERRAETLAKIGIGRAA